MAIRNAAKRSDKPTTLVVDHPLRGFTSAIFEAGREEAAIRSARALCRIYRREVLIYRATDDGVMVDAAARVSIHPVTNKPVVDVLSMQAAMVL